MTFESSAETVSHNQMSPSNATEHGDMPTQDDESELTDKLTASEKIKALQLKFESLSQLSGDFVALLSAATLIATFGLVQNSAGVIIGAMIIAPLMRPLLGLSLGLLTADILLLRRASITLAFGTISAVAVSSLFALILHQLELTPEILARAKPTLLDLGVAIFAGAIGAYCQAKKELQDSLAGVAIAVALVPPLCVVGIGVAHAQPDLWQGALLLYLTNLVGITIAGAIVLLLMGFVSVRTAKHGLVISTLALAVLVVPLAIGMSDMLLENRLTGEVRQLLQEKTHTFKNVKLREVEVRRYRTPTLVVATVFSDVQINSRQVKMVQDFLTKHLNMPLEFRIKIIPITEIYAEDSNNQVSKESGTDEARMPSRMLRDQDNKLQDSSSISLPPQQTDSSGVLQRGTPEEQDSSSDIQAKQNETGTSERNGIIEDEQRQPTDSAPRGFTGANPAPASH